jgi:hypothetical protein
MSAFGATVTPLHDASAPMQDGTSLRGDAGAEVAVPLSLQKEIDGGMPYD